jgi:hypothetical protein
MKKILALVAVLAFGLVQSASATSVMDPIFAAVDITGVSTAVSAAIVGFIGVGLLFLGWRYVKRLGVR